MGACTQPAAPARSHLQGSQNGPWTSTDQTSTRKHKHKAAPRGDRQWALRDSAHVMSAILQAGASLAPCFHVSVPPVTRPAPVTALGAGWCWDWSCTATRRMQCAGPRPCTAGSSMDLRGIGAPARAQPVHWTKRNKTKHPTRRSLCRLSDPGSTRTRRPLGPWPASSTHSCWGMSNSNIPDARGRRYDIKSAHH